MAVSLANVRSHGAQKRVVPEALRAAGGRADFMQLLSPEDPVLAPEDPRDAPDVFIELWDTPATKLTAPTLLAFARFTAVELSPVDRDDRGERPVVWRELTHGPGWDPYSPPAWLQARHGAAGATHGSLAFPKEAFRLLLPACTCPSAPLSGGAGVSRT